MIRACLLLLAGGLAAQHSRVPLGPDVCLLLIAAAVIGVCMRRVRVAGYLLLGYSLFMHAASGVVEARLEARFAGDSLLTEVRVIDFPQLSGPSVTMVVAPISDARLPPRARVRWIDPPLMPAFGDIWQLELRLRRPRGSSNPGGFDLEAWMFREQLHAAGYVVSGKRNQRLAATVLPPLATFRRDMVTRAVEHSQNPESAAVLAAISVGTRHLLTREQWDRYAKTGTSHLMAISGLHVGLAAAAAFLVLALLCGSLRLPGNYIVQAIVGSVLAALLYAWISGFAVPARRAAIMLLCGAAAIIWRRRPDPLRMVAIAAIVVFILDPVSSMSPGFNLSFAAVLVLLWYAKGSVQRDAADRYGIRLLRTLRQLAGMQGALLFGLLPLTVFFFQRVALLAPFVNLLVVPVFSFVTVPLALLAMLLSGIAADVSALLLRFAAMSIAVTESIIRAFATIPVADVTPAGIGGRAACFLLLSVAWVALPRRWPGRWVAVIAVLAVMLHKPAGPPLSCFDAHVLDVGQGLATVIQSHRHTLIFDTGVAYRGGGSSAAQNILPFLKHKGIDDVDWLIVSHADNDHSGGTLTLLENLNIGQTYVGESLPNIAASNCRAGQAWQVDGVSFRVLHPSSTVVRDGNNASCVLEVSAGANNLLLTGDIEAPAEAALLRRGELRSAAVVVIPHHGSMTSSSRAFVETLAPPVAIASTGFNNRWGFPKDKVVARWQGTGSRVLDTATSGAISVRLCRDGGIQQLKEHRSQQRRFWRDQSVQ